MTPEEIAAAQREACARWLEQAGRGADGRGHLRAERVRSTPLVTDPIDSKRNPPK